MWGDYKLVQLLEGYYTKLEDARLQLVKGLEQKVRVMAESGLHFNVRFPYRQYREGSVPTLGDNGRNPTLHNGQVIGYHLNGQNLSEVFVAKRGQYGAVDYQEFGERPIPLDKMDLMPLDELASRHPRYGLDILRQIAFALAEAENSVHHPLM